jgi:hypothetical protein
MKVPKNITLTKYQKEFLNIVKEDFDFSKWVRRNLDEFVKEKLGLNRPTREKDYTKLAKRMK